MTIHQLILYFLSTCFCSCSARGAIAGDRFVYFSKQVKDSFDIYISKPRTFDSSKSYDVFYYLDAEINSGKELRRIVADSSSGKIENTIFIGIGHRGNFHQLRRRDFTIPEISGKDTIGQTSDFGNAGIFYQFLTQELLPFIDSTFHVNQGRRSLLGHSFGGLFVIYSFFKNDTLFNDYYALSPSLWVSHYSIYTYDQSSKVKRSSRKLFLSVGSLEAINRIKAGTDEFDQKFKESNTFPNKYTYKVYQGKSHNSSVEAAIKDILCPG